MLHEVAKESVLHIEAPEVGTVKQQKELSYYSESKKVDTYNEHEGSNISASLPVLGLGLPETQAHHALSITGPGSIEDKDWKLIHFNDDVTQYNGEDLWAWIRRRYIEQFNGQSQGLAIISLHRLRLGKSRAQTKLKVLCALSKDNEDFCSLLQKVLGILENYPGKSLFEGQSATFTPRRAAPGLHKPHTTCLTCIDKGAVCYESHVVDGRCLKCVEDRWDEDPGAEGHECYWEQKGCGIRTYEDALDFYGDTSNKSQSKERSASDDGDSPPPKKRGRNAEKVQKAVLAADDDTPKRGIDFFSSPAGNYPISLQYSLRAEHNLPQRWVWFERRLIGADGIQMTVNLNSRRSVPLNDYRGIRAALEWRM